MAHLAYYRLAGLNFERVVEKVFTLLLLWYFNAVRSISVVPAGPGQLQSLKVLAMVHGLYDPIDRLVIGLDKISNPGILSRT